jgi:Na+/phosphate symporter
MKKGDAKDLIGKIQELSNELEKCPSILLNAFIQNKKDALVEVDSIIQKVKNASMDLTYELISASPSDKNAVLYAPVPSHLERIAGNLEHIARSVGIKIKEDMLFSDKANSELAFLLQRTGEILNATGDLILSRNKVLANYVRESESEIERSATQFATLHEERLIEGLCLPKASGLYIVMLDSIKRIAWNTKEIVEKLTK